jgi:hypothetical protein
VGLNAPGSIGLANLYRRVMMTRILRWASMVLAGGGLFVLNGCDPAIRELLLSGTNSAANGLASTFIDAFFMKLLQQDQTTTMRILEHAVRYVA